MKSISIQIIPCVVLFIVYNVCQQLKEILNEFTPHKFNNISTLKVYITNFNLLIIRVNIVNLYNYWFPLYKYKVRYKYVYELEERKTLGNIESKYRIWISAQCYNRTVDIK